MQPKCSLSAASVQVEELTIGAARSDKGIDDTSQALMEITQMATAVRYSEGTPRRNVGHT